MTKAQTNFRRANQFYHISIAVFFIFMGIMLIILVYQVAHLQGDFTSAQTAELKRQEQARVEARKRLDDALKKTQDQQVVTQKYIRCLASVLLKPVEDRTIKDFDDCGIPGVTEPSQLGQSTSVTGSSSATSTGSQQSSTPASPTPQTAQSKPAETSGSTPPKTPPKGDDRSPLGKLPLVGGLLDALGL